MIKQIINGKSAGAISASLTTADFTILSAVLAGKSENWLKHSEGGVSATIAEPNFIRFSCGKNTINGTMSIAVTVPHLKASKTLQDIHTAVKGVFDCDYDSSVKCEYVNGVGASSRG